MKLPYLKEIYKVANNHENEYPFNLPLFKQDFKITFNKPITIIVGDNGTGKSTLLEVIASHCGFNIKGGNRNHIYDEEEFIDISKFEKSLRFSWNTKINQGFFFRAETFFDFTKYIENNPHILKQYSNEKFSEVSHGEAFLKMFNRFMKGIIILDEPEAALSPQKQLSLLRIIHELEKEQQTQLIIATHSPIIMSYPSANLLYIDEGKIMPTTYQETEHYQITKSFLENPNRYFNYLFEE